MKTNEEIIKLLEEMEKNFLRSFDAYRHHISKRFWNKLKKKYEIKKKE